MGYWGWDSFGQPIIDFYDGQATMTWISAQYEQYGFWGILVAALTPIPYKVFTIASGVFRFDLPTFFFASLVGRGIRFFAVAGLIMFFGPAIKDFIDRRFNLVVVIFTLLLFGGVLVFKLLI